MANIYYTIGKMTTQQPSIYYDVTLRLYKIHSPCSSITQEQMLEAKNRGWHLFIDGHGGHYGLLNAPLSADKEVTELFKSSAFTVRDGITLWKERVQSAIQSYLEEIRLDSTTFPQMAEGQNVAYVKDCHSMATLSQLVRQSPAGQAQWLKDEIETSGLTQHIPNWLCDILLA